jgi:hypothetical protein
MILAVLAALTVSLSPPQPKVGDLITVTFPAPVVLDASREYEVVAHQGNTVVLRTFEPRAFELRGTAGNVRFRNLKVPMTSVLAQGDDLAPAPLAPPRAANIGWLQWMVVALAVLLALALIAFVWRRLRRKKPKAEPVPPMTAEERFRLAVRALREDPSQQHRWAALADETRKYLAATRPQLGSELTTTELVPRLDQAQHVVAEILRQGDLEKFSRRGAAERAFDDLADKALELAS